MAEDQTPKPKSPGEGRSGTEQKPAGGQQGGASDTKPPPPRRS
jgi:hypothetical protein